MDPSVLVLCSFAAVVGAFALGGCDFEPDRAPEFRVNVPTAPVSAVLGGRAVEVQLAHGQEDVARFSPPPSSIVGLGCSRHGEESRLCFALRFGCDPDTSSEEITAASIDVFETICEALPQPRLAEGEFVVTTHVDDYRPFTSSSCDRPDAFVGSCTKVACSADGSDCNLNACDIDGDGELSNLDIVAALEDGDPPLEHAELWVAFFTACGL